MEVAEVSNTTGLSDVVASFSGNFNCFPRSTFSSQSCAIASRPEEEVLAAAGGSSPALMDGPLLWAEVLAVGDSTADGVCYSLQDLVMMSAVVPFAQASWTAAQDMLQGPSLGLRHFTFPQQKQVRRAWQYVVDGLDQKF